MRNIRRRFKSEIRWQDSVNVKGNGKKKIRDGPNIFIADNTIPTIPTRRQRSTPPSAASRKKRSSNNPAATSTSAITTTAAAIRRTSTTPAAAAATAESETSKNSMKTNAGRADNARNSAAGSWSRLSTTSRKRQTSASAKKEKVVRLRQLVPPPTGQVQKVVNPKDVVPIQLHQLDHQSGGGGTQLGRQVLTMSDGG